MNMLIIGNGFDLAHGRPTKYEDFLKFTKEIMRTKTYFASKEQFEATLPDLHADVKRYILSAFEERDFSFDKTTSRSKIIQELYDCLEENVWHEYFQEIIEKDKIRGKGWIDFEIEVREIIEF